MAVNVALSYNLFTFPFSFDLITFSKSWCIGFVISFELTEFHEIHNLSDSDLEIER